MEIAVGASAFFQRWSWLTLPGACGNKPDTWRLPRRATPLGGTRWPGAIVRAGAVAADEYRRKLKEIYAELEEPGGWGRREVVELREGKWDRAALIALLKRAGKNKGNALRAPKSAQRKVRIARELRSRSTATNGCSVTDESEQFIVFVWRYFGSSIGKGPPLCCSGGYNA